MAITGIFEMANGDLAKTLTNCENNPGQWNIYSTIDKSRAHESAHATLLIRKGQQLSDMPVFDVLFMEQNTIENGKLRENFKPMTSKDLQEATGLNHAAHFKKQTGQDAKDDQDAIFFGVSPREVNALAYVNEVIANQRIIEYKMRQVSSNTNFDLGIDNDQDVTNSSHELGNDR